MSSIRCSLQKPTNTSVGTRCRCRCRSPAAETGVCGEPDRIASMSSCASRTSSGTHSFHRLAISMSTPWRVFGHVQPDDHMEMRLAGGVRTSREGLVSEGDLQSATVQRQRPELHHLLALRDRVGPHEPDPWRCAAIRLRSSHIVPGADQPRGHVVERPVAGAEGGDAGAPAPAARETRTSRCGSVRTSGRTPGSPGCS